MCIKCIATINSRQDDFKLSKTWFQFIFSYARLNVKVWEALPTQVLSYSLTAKLEFVFFSLSLCVKREMLYKRVKKLNEALLCKKITLIEMNVS